MADRFSGFNAKPDKDLWDLLTLAYLRRNARCRFIRTCSNRQML
nr:MAG TPA: hypothetical protein [Bacteriophage sp.]DAX11764.1 MAG TPA: hypothetical protein [Bacteriophage sp.]